MRAAHPARRAPAAPAAVASLRSRSRSKSSGLSSAGNRDAPAPSSRPPRESPTCRTAEPRIRLTRSPASALPRSRCPPPKVSADRFPSNAGMTSRSDSTAERAPMSGTDATGGGSRRHEARIIVCYNDFRSRQEVVAMRVLALPVAFMLAVTCLSREFGSRQEQGQGQAAAGLDQGQPVDGVLPGTGGRYRRHQRRRQRFSGLLLPFRSNGNGATARRRTRPPTASRTRRERARSSATSRRRMSFRRRGLSHAVPA